jgi:hypothetical protein
MKRNIYRAEVRNHIPKRVPECLMLRNHSIIVIIVSPINFKKRLSRRDTFNHPRQGEKFHKKLYEVSRDRKVWLL